MVYKINKQIILEDTLAGFRQEQRGTTSTGGEYGNRDQKGNVDINQVHKSALRSMGKKNLEDLGKQKSNEVLTTKSKQTLSDSENNATMSQEQFDKQKMVAKASGLAT